MSGIPEPRVCTAVTGSCGLPRGIWKVVKGTSDAEGFRPLYGEWSIVVLFFFKMEFYSEMSNYTPKSRVNKYGKVSRCGEGVFSSLEEKIYFPLLNTCSPRTV